MHVDSRRLTPGEKIPELNKLNSNKHTHKEPVDNISRSCTASFFSAVIGQELEAVQVHHGMDGSTPAGEEQFIYFLLLQEEQNHFV